MSRDADDGDDQADRDGQPDPVDPLGEGAAQVAGAEVAGDARGGAVGEEDAEPDRGLQHDGGDAEPGQLGGAEVADDGGVGQQEERLGDQGQERRDGQPEDLPVRVRPSPDQPSHGKQQSAHAPYLTSYQHLWMNSGKTGRGRYIDKRAVAARMSVP